jgi:hypothetical protein
LGQPDHDHQRRVRAKLVAEQSGIFLNNQLTDFAPPDSRHRLWHDRKPKPGAPGRAPGLQHVADARARNGVAQLGLGGSGALTIAPNTTQVLLNRLAYGMTVEAACGAAFHHSRAAHGANLWLEAALAKPYAEDLSARGELLLSKDSRNAGAGRRARRTASFRRPRTRASRAARPSATATGSVNRRDELGALVFVQIGRDRVADAVSALRRRNRYAVPRAHVHRLVAHHTLLQHGATGTRAAS